MKNVIQKILILVVFLTISSELLASDRPQVKSLDGLKPNRILFVGNSYLYYNDSLHNHVQRMAAEKFPEKAKFAKYKSSTIGGSRLAHHNLDHLLKAKNIGVKKPFELVILQGGSMEPLSEPARRQFNEQAKTMIEKIKTSGGKAALYMTHAYVKPHGKYAPGMIDDIRSLYVKAGNDNKALVIPVGIAFKKAYQYRPDIVLHKDFDGSHPSLLGTYLAANVVFASIFKTSPVGLKYNYFDAVADEDRDFLQKVAEETVSEFFN
ncbi:MAG: hypothetical protein ABS24_08720 [SAR92 bacterium BACL26 MAG-121220-bin70]|jgi:hypothetical protein|uniref:SGNH hydrolase-type esterase domain-containing protein n=1 Tax=SAR92 bacterium BACL26 MAG-121220-bin70 TaxID=1655626 RepID=A0A0R2UGI7_9GAMM|nr:MAG: hypothetical protein ABS24_08720 [SAR92 bacterium BACL26 MAG-121220-bin70]